MSTSPALSARSTVASLFAARAHDHPDRVAVTAANGARLTYAQLRDRVRLRAQAWSADGLVQGDRVAVLSRNRIEYLECYLAAAWSGLVLAAVNWRLAPPEVAHCLSLVGASRVCVGPELAEALRAIYSGPIEVFTDTPPERPASTASLAPPLMQSPADVDPEDPLVILYTSGTTGLPKGAVISHRALVTRNLVVRAEYGLQPSDAFVAWSPMYHMGGAEYSLGTLMSGGTVHVVDGFDAELLVELVRTEPLGWLLLMPGMVRRFADLLESRGVEPRGVRMCGVMADLVPPADIARVTRLLDAPYANTFGATETGNPPASAGFIPIGTTPTSLPKTPSAFCEIRLVQPDGTDAPTGEPGELWMRGPTLFSGYWANPEATAESFAGGWFHMGDVFTRDADGRLTFVDRAKYLIKSGGENIYPAEIERVLLADPRVVEAAVVKRPDPKWGEVPVAFVARRDGVDTPTSDLEHALRQACRAALAGYKQPKELRWIAESAFPRSASGKVMRHELEVQLAEGGT
jgi:fatty-acyl-CoA synthase